MNENVYILSEKDLNSIINAVEKIASFKERISIVKSFSQANLLKESDSNNLFVEEVEKQIDRYTDLIEYLKESNKKIPEDENAFKEHQKVLSEMFNKLKKKVDEADLSPYFNSKG